MKKTTYIALLVNENNNSIVKFSDFKSVEDFKKFLQDHHLTYAAGDCWNALVKADKEYYEENGDIAGWYHEGLSDYLYVHGDESLTWGEECESVWFVCGNYDSTDDETLEKIFNDLKMIDGVEIAIEFREGYKFGPEAKYYK